MIIGVFLRNVKAYKNINYIPLTYDQHISGILGLNGAGKSTILESFDVFFNSNPPQQMISANSSSASMIAPVFHFKKEEFESLISQLPVDVQDKVKTSVALSKSNIMQAVEVSDSSLSPSQYQYMFPLKLHIKRLKNFNILDTDDVLFTTGINLDKKGAVGYCHFSNLGIVDDEYQSDIVEHIRSFYRYLYIPRELNISSFESLSSENIYYLLESSLSGYMEKIIPISEFTKITKMLRGLLTSVNSAIGDYQFKGRNSQERESLIKKDVFYGLFVKEFFANKVLHYKISSSSKTLSIDNMSSGERQKALVDIIFHLLSVESIKIPGIEDDIDIKKPESSNLILGIDEPDSSLHVSACFDQYKKIQKIADCCHQTLMTSHWYGYIPVSQDAATVFIGARDKENKTDFITSFCLSNSNFVDDLKFVKNERKETIVPVSIGTKGISDLTMSIMHAISGGVNCDWVVCEGASDRVYLDSYIKKLGLNVTVISVGGVDNLKSIYSIINAHYHEIKSSVKNKIIFISDTDANCVDDTGVSKAKNLSNHIMWFRIINKSSTNKTVLIDVSDSLKAPVTTVEDSLNGIIYRLALLELKEELPQNVRDYLCDNTPRNDAVPAVSLNFTSEIQASLKSWFDDHQHGNRRKFSVATAYVNVMNSGDYSIPDWINCVAKHLNSR